MQWLRVLIRSLVLWVSWVCLGLTAVIPSASAQTDENIPQPEYYGNYFVVSGKLFGIGELVGKNVPKSASLPEPIEVRYGVQATPAEISRGVDPAKITMVNVRPMRSDIQFLIFSQDPMKDAEKLGLEQLVYIRDITINVMGNVGTNQRIPHRGQENAWDAGEGIGLDRKVRRLTRGVKLLLKPVKGHSDLVLAVPVDPLKAGLYLLTLNRARFALFAVNPVKEGEQTTCTDVVSTYGVDTFGLISNPEILDNLRTFRCRESLGEAPVRSSEYPLAGFWKDKCSDNWGLAIAPAGNGYYSISFCGPRRCFEPGTFRPNSKIINDPDYRVIDNDTIEMRGKDGWTRNLRCPVPPMSPQPPVRIAKPVCTAATDLGYSLLAAGHLYKVKGIASASGGQVHVFFDEKGSPVQDQNLLQKLALGAWARENVVVLPDARNGTRRVSAVLSTSQALQQYEMVQDALARGMAEAVEAAVTSGASLTQAVPRLTWATVSSQLTKSPRTVLTLIAQRGLQHSLERYTQLESTLPPADSTALDVATLEKAKDLYTQAQALELPNEALAAALMPKTAGELTNQALQSMAGELVAGLPKSNEAVTLAGLLNLQKSLATFRQSFPVLQTYNERLNLALNLAQANDRKVGEWAQLATSACSP